MIAYVIQWINGSGQKKYFERSDDPFYPKKIEGSFSDLNLCTLYSNLKSASDEKWGLEKVYPKHIFSVVPVEINVVESNLEKNVDRK